MQFSKLTTLLLAIAVGIGCALSLFSIVEGSVGPLPPRPPLPTQGGLIKLVVSTTQVIEDGTHTVVQWRHAAAVDHDMHADDEWHNVETWRGTFDHTREIVWYVAPGEMGAQYFRWVVFDKDDAVLAISDEFQMPFTTWEPRKVWVGWE